MIHNSLNIKHGSIRTIASTATIRRWLIFLKDGVQAYIQSDELTRYIAQIPAPEFGLARRILLRVLKFLYGLSESGDSWQSNFFRAIIRLLNMRKATGDQALYLLPAMPSVVTPATTS